MILALGLALVLAFVDDRFDRLLVGGVVHGDVEQVAGGIGLQIANCPREERADDVRVNDIKKGVASF